MMARGLKAALPNKGGKKEAKFDKPQNIKATLKRLLRYMLAYRWQLPVVAICVIISALSGVAGTYFIRPLINDYIVPLIGQQSPDLSGFISLILTVAALYVAGVLATWAYQRIMLNISTGVLKRSGSRCISI